MMDNFLKNIRETKENFQVPIKLGENGSHYISFVEIHLKDLKAILNGFE